MPDESAKVATEHEGANGAINALREVATTLKTLGDDNIALEQERDAARDHSAGLDEIIATEAGFRERLEEWEDLLHNFRQGVIDKGELLAGTVGAHD